MIFMDNYVKIVEKMKASKRIAVLTGAGVSAESGIKTFRDPDGLWSKFNPQELASMNGFMKNPELVWEWYNYRREIISSVEPNEGHFALAEFQRILPDFSLITQNVDRLHHRASSTNVIELHGNIIDNHCSRCESPYSGEIDLSSKSIPKCNSCGSYVRPSVVWFGEMLPQDALEKASYLAETSDVFFSIGTSAEVYPAAHLPMIAKDSGALVVEINPNTTALTKYIDIHLAEPSARALPKLLELLKNDTKVQ